MIEFFLRRPLFAGVLSFVVLLAGLVTIPTLPIAQYPQISPPTVTVTSQYPGATAAMVMRSVTTPLEININGSDGLQYMQSYSSANGTSVITCTFALGTDPTTDQTNVQHGVDLTLAQLPSAVQNQGVSVQKSSGNITIAVAMLSTSSAVSDVAVSNYADLNVIENLKRVPGVGQVEVLGDRTYSMRIWVDPHKLEANNISIDTLLNVIKQNNADVAPGAIGQPPTTGSQPFQIPISINGRLQTPEEFKQIVVQAQPNGGYLRLGDVAQVELGAENYITSARYNGQTSVVLAIEGEPTANSLQISKNVRATMAADRADDANRLCVQDRVRYFRLRARLDQGSRHHAADRDPARRPRHLRLPAELAQYAHPGDDYPHLADRNLCGDEAAGLFHQYAHALRLDPRYRAGR